MFPDAHAHVYVKLDEATDALAQLLHQVSSARDHLQQAGQLRAYFDEHGELL